MISGKFPTFLPLKFSVFCRIYKTCLLYSVFLWRRVLLCVLLRPGGRATDQHRAFRDGAVFNPIRNRKILMHLVEPSICPWGMTMVIVKRMVLIVLLDMVMMIYDLQSSMPQASKSVLISKKNCLLMITRFIFVVARAVLWLDLWYHCY